MYINFAHLGLILVLILSILALMIAPFFKTKKIERLQKNIILLNFILVSYAFLCLIYAYTTSDFTVKNVYNNSHIAVPLLYKFTGMWSNHEGSMLLWIFILSTSTLIISHKKLEKLHNLWLNYSLILINACIIAYTILCSNPFELISPVPANGRGFNPLLQDIGLAIHPPVLYIGYITSSLGFSVAMTMLFSKEVSETLLSLLHKVTLLSWSFLLAGITLGSWWAYRELGWGGYWYWDPVENASLLPLLSSTALIHSIYVTKKLKTNYRTTILLSILTFLFSILSTFFVRSGVVTSVHSFASDPTRGNFILIIITLLTIYSLGAFATRGAHFSSKSNAQFYSRYGSINLANILWISTALIIMLALLYPLIIEIYQGSNISIDRNFFEKTTLPILITTLIALAFGLPSAWEKTLPSQTKDFLYSLLITAIISIIYIYKNINKISFVSAFAFFAGILVIIRMIFWYNSRKSSPLKLKFYLILIIHLAAGIISTNLSITETFAKEETLLMKEGEVKPFSFFKINFAKKENLAINNFIAGRAILYIEKDNQEIAILTPEVRYYPVEKSQTSESSIYSSLFYDIYVVINEITPEGEIIFNFYYKPLISWLWTICGLIFFAGMILLFKMKESKNETKN